jgi:hypothetical protein
MSVSPRVNYRIKLISVFEFFYSDKQVRLSIYIKIIILINITPKSNVNCYFCQTGLDLWRENSRTSTHR